ncbi:MAG: HlyD family efflux transporter periplasmic adaptor subunit [Tissierellia bacterium]|nr:HlyD family efflux transporter periplasmic adaptor subunit [Tissierellia bacterium]
MSRGKKDRGLGVLFLVLFLLLLMVLGFVFRQLTGVRVPYDLIPPQATLYRDVALGEGYLLLRESTAKTGASGVATYFADEGQKVQRDYIVANVNVLSDHTEVKDELIKVQAAIDYKNDENPKRSPQFTEEEINTVRNIQRFIRDEDYENLISGINSLELSSARTVSISQLNEYLQKPMKELEEEKEALSRQLATTNSDYRAKEAGMVSFFFDDPRGRLSMDRDPEQFTLENLHNLKLDTMTSGANRVEEGAPFFRIIDNLGYRVAMVIDSYRLIEDYVDGSFTMKFGEGILVPATFVAFNGPEDGPGVAIFELHDQLERIYEKRHYNLTLIKREVSAYTVPTSALIEDAQGNRGVYVERTRGFVSFVPVDILSETNEEAYIRSGNKGTIEREVDGKTVQVATVNSFDRVVKNPEDVPKEQIIFEEEN